MLELLVISLDQISSLRRDRHLYSDHSSLHVLNLALIHAAISFSQGLALLVTWIHLCICPWLVLPIVNSLADYALFAMYSRRLCYFLAIK